MSWLVVLSIVAVWRAARLIAIDHLALPVRQLANRVHPKVGYLFECPWCISIWLGVPMVWAATEWPHSRWLFIVYAALTASGLAGMLTTLEDKWDRS